MTSVYSPQLFSKLSSEWYLATALYDAIDDGNLREAAILLQEKHADPNVVIPDYDISPFHLAVGHENELFAREVTKLLLKNGGDPNVRDNEGVTPLHVAAVWNRPTIVRILLSYGGDPMITDDAEKNAFHYAYEEHAWDTLKTLEVHRRAEMKKNTDKSDKNYSIQLDKVIIQGDGVQAEYRALCDGCKKDAAVSTKSVATQTSSPRVKLEEINESEDLDIFFDAETSGKIRPASYDWCEKATGVMLTDDCKRKITTHRTKSRIFEYNPIFDRQMPGDVERRVCDFRNLYLCCAKVDLEKTRLDKVPEDVGEHSTTGTKESIEMTRLTKVTVSTSTTCSQKPKEANGNGENYSEDSLMAADATSPKDSAGCTDTKESVLNDADIPFIDESSAESSQNCGDKNPPSFQQKEVTVEVHQADEPEPNQSQKEAVKHVSWSGCLSTCACIPKKLNESDSSIYFTNPESDAENKSKQEQSLPLSGINELSYRTEKSDDFNADEENLISNDESEVDVSSLPKAPLNISVEYKYTDDEDGIEFVEARLPLCLSSSNSNASTPTRLGIEKEKKRQVEEPETSDGTAYDTDQIRIELKKLGFVSGPIAGTTKRLYLRKLRKIKRSVPNTEVPIFRPIFSPELEHVLRADNDDWEKTLTKWSCLETEILNHFSNSSLSSTWRSGTAKTSFIYLLLDPRVSNNLPARCEQMDLGDVWRDFIHAIFYIGKGTRARPYEHLHEAFLVWRETKTYPRKRYSLKVRHILDIWNDGLGVVCLQVFHNIIPAEAYTREAAMIDAISLARLKNEKAGIYYGVAASWNARQKKRLGVFLLYRAMRMFIADNEVQLKPTDVR